MLNTVFLDPNYGTITSHLFAYCLTALFVSRLKANNLPLPMPLHVSCSRNSNVYRLIEIIDSICDVNVPVPEICPSYFSYGSCDDVPLVQYPTHNTSDDLHHLMQQRDVPIIVAGFNAEPDLDALLKAVANQSADVKPLGLSRRDPRDKHKLLVNEETAPIVRRFFEMF